MADRGPRSLLHTLMPGKADSLRTPSASLNLPAGRLKSESHLEACVNQTGAKPCRPSHRLSASSDNVTHDRVWASSPSACRVSTRHRAVFRTLLSPGCVLIFPPRSCTLCRRRKIRCNKELPCSNCRKSSKNHCVFDSPPRPSQVSNTANTKANETDTDTASSLSEETSLGATPSTVATSLGPPSQALESDCFNLKLRVRQLEHQLQHTSTGQSAALRSTCLSSLETTSSRVSGTFHLLRETSTTGRSQRIVQRVAHKARLFGQSHWVAHGVPLVGVT